MENPLSILLAAWAKMRESNRKETTTEVEIEKRMKSVRARLAELEAEADLITHSRSYDEGCQ